MDFILVDDGLSASHLRQQLAEHSPSGLKVGNFATLLETLSALWLLPISDDLWHHELQNQALRQTKAFWAKSIRVDEQATLAQLAASLRFLLAYLPLNERLQPLARPDNRNGRYYNDLVQLHKAMGYQRPPDQDLACRWLTQAKAPSIEPVYLHLDLDKDRLLPWQLEVVQALQALFPIKKDHPLSGTLRAISAAPQPSAKPLQQFTKTLFDPEHSKPLRAHGDHLHWLASRDPVEEVQVVTIMVAQALAKGTPAQAIAILYPYGTDYPLWIEQSFAKAGILISNLRANDAIYDWQRALIHDLLDCHTPSPSPMAWMSVLTNPLMPWSAAKGHYFAERLAERKLKIEEHQVEHPLLAVLFEPVASDSHALTRWLGKIADAVRPLSRFTMTDSRLQQQLEDLETLFSLYQELPFDEQLARVLTQLQPGAIPLTTEKERLLNAVTALSDRETLPFAVEELFVLGFNQSHYTYRPEKAGALSRQILDTMDDLPLQIPAITQQQQQWQIRFRGQLTKACERITFTLSLHTYDGSPLSPSESLLDMALCVQRKEALKPERLIEPAHSATHPLLTYQLRDIDPHQEVALRDLELGCDLLRALESLHGERRGESPSSLEKLMTMPLAWLLNRLRIESRQWKPQQLDIQTQGKIAHKVLELYKDHQSSPLTNKIYQTLFDKAIAIEAPFLVHPQWRLERTQLQQQIAHAVFPLVAWIKEAGWKISHVEEELAGELWNWSVRGFADAILTKGRSVLILDYKKSKSKDRITRLNNGLDLQTWIYRELYQQMNSKKNLHSGYYNLNDTTLVLDDPALNTVSHDPLTIAIPELSINEQSALAKERIKQRFGQIRKGSIVLNMVGDPERWKKQGITLYSLEQDRLVNRYLKPNEEASA